MTSFRELTYVICPLSDPFASEVDQGLMMDFRCCEAVCLSGVWVYGFLVSNNDRDLIPRWFPWCLLPQHVSFSSHVLHKCFAPSQGQGYVISNVRSVWHLIVIVDSGCWRSSNQALQVYISSYSSGFLSHIFSCWSAATFVWALGILSAFWRSSFPALTVSSCLGVYCLFPWFIFETFR